MGAGAPAEMLLPRAVATVASAWGWRLDDVVPVVDYGHRAVFRARLDERVVFVKAELGRERFDRELLGREVAASVGIPVPELLAALPGELTLLALAEVNGQPLSELSDPGAWASAGSLLARLHETPVPFGMGRFDHREPSWSQFIVWWAAHEVTTLSAQDRLPPTLARRVRDAFEGVFADVSTPRVALHADYQADHVLFNDRLEVSGVLDWGDAASGDPLWDVAVLTCWRPDRLQDALAGYGALPPARQQLIPWYWLVRHLGAATWCDTHGYDSDPHLDRAVRLFNELHP